MAPSSIYGISDDQSVAHTITSLLRCHAMPILLPPKATHWVATIHLLLPKAIAAVIRMLLTHIAAAFSHNTDADSSDFIWATSKQ